MTTENTAAPHGQIAWPGKLTFVLICLTVAIPMLAAYWIYNNNDAVPKGTINKGQLIVPATHLGTTNYRQTTGSELDWLSARKWNMVTVTDGTCNEHCQQNLYYSRQVHVRLAKEAERIQRLLLIVNDNPNFNNLPEIAMNDSGLTVASITPRKWQELFTNSMPSNATNTLMLVDQAGFAMMSYSKEHSGSDILDDLKRLLKYSYQ